MANNKLLIRKLHRYLGVFIGIQFIFWTVSGVYFSWNKLENVHGDHMRKSVSYLPGELNIVSPSVAIQNLKKEKEVDSVHSIHLVRVVDKPTYQIHYFSGHVGEGMHLHLHYAMADATTGELRKNLTREEAVAVAKEQLTGTPSVIKAEYITNTNGHHEYREKPLPAWSIDFANPDCTLYVSAELGTFQTIRHNQWRIFDFLWMTHVMDYETRDDIGNWLLRIFSIFGMLTVFSGFTLYFTSRRKSPKR